MVLQAWLMRTSLRQLAGFGVAGATAIVGGALGMRQLHLRNSPVVDAATQQLRSADAVRELLGSAVASTSGVLGGYTDPVGGTACITMPVVSEGGVRAIARVEAEAEWLVKRAHAEARGETPVEHPKGETCRWLLRHLEIELDCPKPADGTSSSGSNATTVLYSLPPNAKLSSWAPSREPSALPRWLRALLPEPSAVTENEASPRLLVVGAFAIAAHAFVFGRLHRRMINEKMLRRAETMLTLPESSTHEALAQRAFEIAAEAAGTERITSYVRSSGAPLYGHATASKVRAFTSLRSQQEFYFQAERTQAKKTAQKVHAQPAQRQQKNAAPAVAAAGEEWTLTAVSVAPTEFYSKKLAALPQDADEAALLKTILSVEMQPVELGLSDRKVVVRARTR